MTLEAWFPRSVLYFLPRKHAGDMTAPSKFPRSKELRFEVVVPRVSGALGARCRELRVPRVSGPGLLVGQHSQGPGEPWSLASPPAQRPCEVHFYPSVCHRPVPHAQPCRHRDTGVRFGPVCACAQRPDLPFGIFLTPHAWKAEARTLSRLGIYFLEEKKHWP